MFTPPFCPYAACIQHLQPTTPHWWRFDGFHHTKAFGRVQRYQCLHCERTFSVQTFSVHYYAKRVIRLKKLERLAASSMGTRALSREFNCSCGSITNRIDRISRQGVGLHTSLRKLATTNEPVCFDGLVTFESSQYFPSDIGISITSETRFMLGLSHASTRRSGAMRDAQKTRRDTLYAGTSFEEKAVERSFTEHLDMLEQERDITLAKPLVLVTDEKKEYDRAFHKHGLYSGQHEARRCARIRISSTDARVFANPLFASNYIDREIRKDQANHRRETTCFARSAANTMSRLYSYLVHHNYAKRYLIKWPVHRTETAASLSGIPGENIKRMRSHMFTRRTFLTHLDLLPMDLKVWTKTVFSPTTGGMLSSKLPAYAFG